MGKAEAWVFNHKSSGVSTTKEVQFTAELDVQAQPASFADFAQLYDALFPRIYNYVSYRVARREEAEDLVGTIFEKALANFAKFDTRKGNIESWLFTIAHHTVVNYYRSHKRHPQTELDENLETNQAAQPDQAFLQREEMERLRRNLGKMGERDRELIALRYGASFSHRQIGHALKMKEGSVTVALSRAVGRLRKLFEAEEDTK